MSPAFVPCGSHENSTGCKYPTPPLRLLSLQDYAPSPPALLPLRRYGWLSSLRRPRDFELELLIVVETDFFLRADDELFSYLVLQELRLADTGPPPGVKAAPHNPYLPL